MINYLLFEKGDISSNEALCLFCINKYVKKIFYIHIILTFSLTFLLISIIYKLFLLENSLNNQTYLQ